MKSLLAAVAILGFSAGPAFAVCSYPKAPEKIPDGNTATRDEMVAAQNAVRQFDKEINEYTDCLKLEHDGQIAKQGSTLTEAQKKDLDKRETQKHNAAVDELEQVAARLNEQIRIFKAKAAKS